MKNLIILFANIFAFLTNIIFFCNYNRIAVSFKHSDSFIISFQKKNIKKIYNWNFNSFKLKKRKTISIYFIDSSWNNTKYLKFFTEFLKQLNFIVEIKKNNPDYLIYDIFGCNHTQIQYNSSIKIAFYSENIIPDFSEADYSISQSHIIYLDRYFKYPFFIRQLNKFRRFKVENIRFFQKHNKKRKFCAAVISNNSSCTKFRMEFIKRLNKYKHVDMGGSYLNNVGGKVKNKIQFFSSYKFSISMENSGGDGYASEKIIDSLIAGTIPIYYGDYLIDE